MLPLRMLRCSIIGNFNLPAKVGEINLSLDDQFCPQKITASI